MKLAFGGAARYAAATALGCTCGAKADTMMLRSTAGPSDCPSGTSVNICGPEIGLLTVPIAPYWSGSGSPVEETSCSLSLVLTFQLRATSRGRSPAYTARGEASKELITGCTTAVVLASAMLPALARYVPSAVRLIGVVSVMTAG